MNKPLIIIFSILSFAVVSCSNDDEPGIPDNAITLNMMSVDRNSTIGNTDVYINSADNFTSSYCEIADLGRKGGFSRKPSLSQLGREVAVTSGNYYQIFYSRDFSTVADGRAYPVNARFYNVFVDSWIYDKENEISGAKVTYAECYPDARPLPEWDSEITIRLKSLNGDVPETGIYSFPKGCKIDDDVETSDIGASSMKNYIDIDVNGNTISVSNSAWTPSGIVKAELYVRYENLYTRVTLNIESSVI